jgi:hypothetical protein
VGSTAFTSGTQLEKVEGYITSIVVATGQSGSEAGNALRSMMARVYKIGAEGIEAQGKPEKMLQEMGVAVRDSGGQFRDFGAIMDDLNGKWGSLTETEKIATAQQVAGIQRYNEFMSMMNNYEMGLQATETALNSQGSAMKENEIYMQSAQAKIEQLKTTLQDFAINAINSDLLKGGIDALTKLVEVFGNLPAIIGLATTAFLVFKGTAISSSLATLSLGTSLGKLKIAIMGNPLGLFAVALTTIITLMASAETSADRLEKSLSKMDEAQRALSDMKDTSKVVSQYEELEDKINSGTLSTEEMTTAKKDLVTMQETLAKTFPSIINGFNDEGTAIVTNLDKVNEKIKETNENSLNDMKSAYSTAFNAIAKDTPTMWEEIKREYGDIYDRAEVRASTAKTEGEYGTRVKDYRYFLELQKMGVVLTKKQQEEYQKVAKEIDSVNNLTYEMYQMGGDLEGYQIIDKADGSFQNAQEYYKAIKDGADDSTKKNAELRPKTMLNP